jgi:hypothetical protein
MLWQVHQHGRRGGARQFYRFATGAQVKVKFSRKKAQACEGSGFLLSG